MTLKRKHRVIADHAAPVVDDLNQLFATAFNVHADACRARGLEDVTGLVGTALPERAAPPSTRGAEYAR